MTTKTPSEKKKTVSGSSLQIKMKKYEEEIARLNQELTEKKEQLLRAYADMQNAQKRMEKECQNRDEENKKKYLITLLDLHELLQKAYVDPDPKQGLKLILSNIEKIFQQENIRCIDCKGKTFDHTIHHAVTTVEKHDCADGMIVDEVKKGYFLGDKLLRPSQVVVNKKTEQSQQEGKNYGQNCRN
ncbi:MAG: nucleotide exchange factor GrpE [Candidatus Thermoplasmatota archaeon]